MPAKAFTILGKKLKVTLMVGQDHRPVIARCHRPFRAGLIAGGTLEREGRAPLAKIKEKIMGTRKYPRYIKDLRKRNKVTLKKYSYTILPSAHLEFESTSV